jgi:hypothetical protein
MDRGLQWLLASGDQAVRNLASSDLLGQPFDSASTLQSPRVQRLLKPQPGHPYSNKWKGAHWRLVSLVELGVGPEPPVLAAVEQVLAWILSDRVVRVVRGLPRRHASMEGNTLAVCCRLGLADERVGRLRDLILDSQWPDGGWNCDPRPGARHSSFHESLATLWGLVEYERTTGDDRVRQAGSRAAEFFLRHQLFRSERSGRTADPEWVKFHYPPYWHYDILQALLVLVRGSRVDARATGALDLLESKRRPDGTWTPSGLRYWRAEGKRVNRDVVDWDRSGSTEMLTLNALRVLRATGRIQLT